MATYPWKQFWGATLGLTRLPPPYHFSLSDASIPHQAASAVAELVTSQSVESAVAGFDHAHIVAR